MKQVTSVITQFRGSHYDFGYYQGELLQESAYLKNRSFMNESLFKKFTINLEEITDLYHQFAPFLLDEINGLKDCLQLPIEVAYMHFAGFFANRPSGCSIFMQPDYMIRNYDQAPNTYDGRLCLFQPTDGGYATAGPSMMITGRTDRMNEHGLCIGYNFVNSRQHQDGFVCNMIARIVLETCKTIEEAIHLLTEIPHKHSFNYCLLDASGQSVVVEATPRAVTTRSALVCTNHFQQLTAENRYTMADSIRREKKLLQVAHTEPNWQNGYALLNNLDQAIFATKYDAWDGTIHTATYLPKERLATISFGANKKPVAMQFKKWLDGTDLLITKVKGELDAKHGFVYTSSFTEN